ncbi:MAG TPA: hypothetical protein VFP27_11735 [Mycobacterium sp.]|nr:hypothetical protein [Mycobacterium sp.]
MNMFRAFEHQAWEDAEVCAAYHDRLGEVVVQVIEPMLDALSVGAADRVLDVATGTGLERVSQRSAANGPIIGE